MDFIESTDLFGETKNRHKTIFLFLGFFTVMAIIFSFQLIGQNIKGLGDNYRSLFCSNLK